MQSLNQECLQALLSCFDKIYSSENLLVLDNKLSPIINYLVPFKQFREQTKTGQIIWLSEVTAELIKLVSNVVVLIDESSGNELQRLQSTKFTLIVKNLTKAFLYTLNQQFQLGVTFDDLLVNDKYQSGVRLKNLRVFSWEFQGILLDDNIITLQDKVSNYFDQPVYQINQLNTTLVDILIKFNFKVNNVYYQGNNSYLLYKLFNQRLIEQLSQHYNNLQQEFYLNQLQPSHNLIILERNLDFLPVIMNQLNYAGLIDDFLGVNINLTKTSNQQQQLKLDDSLYDNLKDLNFSLIGLKLNTLARFIKNQYSSSSADVNLKEIKSLVENLTDLNHQQELIKKHTNLSEELLDIIKFKGNNKYNEHEIFLNFENEVFQMSYKQQYNKILEFLNMNLSSDIMINSLILVSVINHGIKSRDYDTIKTMMYENFGLKIINTLQNLINYNLIRFSDLETSQPENEGITGGQFVYKNNYNSLNRFWSLHPDDEEEEEESEDISEINSLSDYKHPSFTLPSNTVPLTIRLLQSLYTREFLTYKPINKITNQPSWENLPLDRMFTTKTNEIKTKSVCDNTILVFLGGITRSEISCIKYLNQVLNAKGLNKQFIVITNGITNNKELIEALE